ncbi:YdcF family protein [Biformimicrobium ophioploci]|uniref:YdcF family protein n=1 Tax=Biformimicrobium ophioploci TaxID=3036711 RepID=A0ABQ6LWM8_9GAMM|nr:YdcF family protein [Microbulbifer sp. NKW57]GMG86493.1 YdcF family protein [Microbulbifer sp. NKW57]
MPATKLLSDYLLLAPAAPLLLALLAFILRYRRPHTAMTLATLAFLALWVVSTPAFSARLGLILAGLQAEAEAGIAPRAIVVLGGGRARNPLTGAERLSATSLERAHAGALLARREAKPVLTSGGTVFAGEEAAESVMMADALRLMGVEPRWQEGCSRTTAENAVNSAELLKHADIQEIYLVTHWWHMPRAQSVFRRAGLKVVPAPVGGADEVHRQLAQPVMWLPSPSALYRSQTYWRELLGMAWYRLRPLAARTTPC